MTLGSHALAFLTDELARRQKRNARYSLRAFARHAGVDASALRQILAKQRPLTVSVAATILTRLAVPTETLNMLLLSLINPENYREGEARFRQLLATESPSLRDWRCFAVLCALELKAPPQTVQAVAAHLGEPVAAIKPVVATLERLGMVRRDGSKLTISGEKLTFAGGVDDDALRLAHAEYIDKARASLFAEPVLPQDFSGITMAIDAARFPEAVRRIREFRRALAADLGAAEKTAVYRINIQLIPLTAAEEPR